MVSHEPIIFRAIRFFYPSQINSINFSSLFLFFLRTSCEAYNVPKLTKNKNIRSNPNRHPCTQSRKLTTYRKQDNYHIPLPAHFRKTKNIKKKNNKIVHITMHIGINECEQKIIINEKEFIPLPIWLAGVCV